MQFNKKEKKKSPASDSFLQPTEHETQGEGL